MDRLDKMGEALLKHPETDLSGVGNQIISIESSDLRRLADLPIDVEIVRTVPPPDRVYDVPISWTVPRPDQTFLYIRHRFCFRCAPGQIMCTEPFDQFLRRFKELEKQYGLV